MKKFAALILALALTAALAGCRTPGSPDESTAMITTPTATLAPTVPTTEATHPIPRHRPSRTHADRAY